MAKLSFINNVISLAEGCFYTFFLSVDFFARLFEGMIYKMFKKAFFKKISRARVFQEFFVFFHFFFFFFFFGFGKISSTQSKTLEISASSDKL